MDLTLEAQINMIKTFMPNIKVEVRDLDEENMFENMFYDTEYVVLNGTAIITQSTEIIYIYNYLQGLYYGLLYRTQTNNTCKLSF